jgi:hypothetical protein
VTVRPVVSVPYCFVFRSHSFSELSTYFSMIMFSRNIEEREGFILGGHFLY